MSAEKKRILCIDDSIVIQRLVQARLRADGFDVRTATGGTEGVTLARQYDAGVILLDVDMPSMNGYEACRILKDDPATRNTPIIFLTAKGTIDDKVRGLDLGAIDYVTKPFDPIELRARVRSAYRTKYLMDLLEKRAQIDGLTGLYNRAFFDERLAGELNRGRRYGTPVALVMFDVDRFKTINDSFGHSFGDIVLAEIGEVARSAVRLTDVVSRYGGEEFAIILPEQGAEGGRMFAERVRAAVEAICLMHSGQAVPVTASFGVSTSELVGFEDPKTLVETADAALYDAKRAGRNRVCLAEPASAAAVV